MSKSFLKVIWNIQTWDKLMRFWLMLLRKMKILMHTVDKKFVVTIYLNKNKEV